MGENNFIYDHVADELEEDIEYLESLGLADEPECNEPPQWSDYFDNDVECGG